MSKLPPNGKHIMLSPTFNKYIVFYTERPKNAKKDRTVIVGEARSMAEAEKIARENGLLP